jgi:NAD-dependent protein deacetylase/lipoamidase
MSLHPDLVARLTRVRPARLLVVSGAGISAESGIPTYRGENGLWRHLDFERMATREAFLKDRQRLWNWYQERRQTVVKSKPNQAHYAVVELVRNVPQAMVVTQNVDDLHERAGLPLERLAHVHGRILETRCEHCGLVTEASPSDAVRPCTRCNESALRPNVVWFDEELPDVEVEHVERFLAEGSCDLVLVVGTTAAFDYVRDWIERAAGKEGLVIDVNPEMSAVVGAFPERAWHLREQAGLAVPEVVHSLS